MKDPVGASVPAHGTRSNYVRGCRCNRCRAANADYIRDRRKVRATSPKQEDEVVDAACARAYLETLSSLGIGRNSVHKACGVGKRLIWNITSGRAQRILRSTEERLLSVHPDESLPRGANVDADVTLQQINALLKEGFTRSDIATRLNRFSDRLRIGEKNKVRASSALKINKLYRALMPVDDEQDKFTDAA